MLQDLMIPPRSVVPGDHVVYNGRFYKVLESRKPFSKDEKTGEITMIHDGWELVLEDPTHQEGQWPLTFYGREKEIRVRPCGPSNHCEES